MTAKLPLSRERTNTIAHMKIGESRWIVPWAMLVDSNRECYLLGDYSTYSLKYGTVDTRVTRIEAGYVVDIQGTDYMYALSGVDQSHDDLIPVFEVVA